MLNVNVLLLIPWWSTASSWWLRLSLAFLCHYIHFELHTWGFCDILDACDVYSVECVSKITSILSTTFYAKHVNACFQLTHFLSMIVRTLRWRHNGHDGSQITSLTIVYSTVYSGADQRKHQSSASLAFARGIHRWPVNSPHKWSVTRKMFSFDGVIMLCDFIQPGQTARWELPSTSGPSRLLQLKFRMVISDMLTENIVFLLEKFISLIILTWFQVYRRKSTLRSCRFSHCYCLVELQNVT